MKASSRSLRPPLSGSFVEHAGATDEVSADLPYLLALSSIGCAIALLASPWGDFPINDDWSYSAAVRALVERGVIAYTDWTSMPLLPQLAWGALFAKAFGTGHETLRMSALVVWLITLSLSYGAAREARARPPLAAVAALCIGANPLAFSLALSFMTDLYFVALVTATLWAWLRYFRTGSKESYALGTALAVVATLERQLGVALPLAFALTLCCGGKLSWRSVGRALAPLFVVLLSHLAYDRYVSAVIGRPAFYDDKLHGLVAVITHPGFKTVRDMMTRAVAVVAYFGLLLAPLWLLIMRVPRSWSKHRALHGSGVALLCVAAAWSWFQPPPLLSLIHASGVGLMSLSGGATPEAERTFELGWHLAVLAGLAIAGCSALGRMCDRPSSTEPSDAPARTSDRDLARFILFATLGLLAPVLPTYPMFDRYLLPVLPLLTVFAVNHIAKVPRTSRARMVLAGALTFLLAAVSTLTAQDSFAWNRARWAAIADARAYGALAEWIDGGFEHNAAFAYGSVSERGRPSRAAKPLDPRWTVSFGVLPGYTVVRRYVTGSWLHPAREVVLAARLDALEPSWPRLFRLDLR